MKICLLTTHSFPIPWKTHTGDVVILDLAFALQRLGNEVTVLAPEGSIVPDKVKFLPIKPSFGKYPPASHVFEEETFNTYKDFILTQDIFHDFSVTKTVIGLLNKEGFTNTISTIMGGAWPGEFYSINVVGWCKNHADRIKEGKSDHWNTPTNNMAAPDKLKIKNVKIVNGGINTTFYSPTYDKEDFYLWMNRWHEAKGYKQAIEFAKLNPNLKVILAGEHPDNETFEHQRNCALEVLELSKDVKNISIFWLPPDPDHHFVKRELYRKAKALLYTIQFHEPFGLSQTEALACGTPVIGLNYGSVSEIINSEKIGIVCNSVEEISSKLNIIENINPIDCRNAAVNRFDRSVMAKNYLELYKKITSKTMVTKTFKEKQFNVDTGSVHPGYSIYTFDEEEKDLKEKYWNIKENDVVFDIGASYGGYAIPAGALGAKVYAFEPEKTVFCDLVHNIELNNFDIQAYDIGFWNEDIEKDMRDYAPHWPTQCISELFKLTTIDKFVKENNIEKIDWIKIDVEGAEENVIDGGINSIKQFRPNLIIECHNFLNPRLSENIKKKLIDIGYNIEEIKRDPCIMLIGKI